MYTEIVIFALVSLTHFIFYKRILCLYWRAAVLGARTAFAVVCGLTCAALYVALDRTSRGLRGGLESPGLNHRSNSKWDF
jgi:hypothetical protein